MKYILLLLITIVTYSQLKAQQIDLQAHRGGRGLMPENTVPAMLNGVRLGAQTLELDCYITADGKAVVSHDPYMSSVFMLNPDGSEITKAEEKELILYKMTYDSIRRFQEGVKDYPVFPEQQKVKTYKPLLSELIDRVESFVKINHLKPVYYNIETKSVAAQDNISNPVPGVFVNLLMAVVNEKHIADRVIIQSFDVRTLQVLHQQMPQIKTSLLFSTGDYDSNVKLLGFTPTIISPDMKLVTADMVKAAHDNNVKVIPWTVNTEADMKSLADLKVDGMISDYPDRLVKLFGSYQAK